MSLSEKQNAEVIEEAVAPFIIDSEYGDEEKAASLCRQLAVSFGGSGFKSSVSVSKTESEVPELLSAPVRIIEGSGLETKKQTYGGVVFIDTDNPNEVSSNTEYDAKAIPKTRREKKRKAHESEQLARKLRAEAEADMQRRMEMAAARMAAIRAARSGAKSSSKACTGVNIESFGLPHPSGRGELLSDVSLTLSWGRRYGLIGRNGAGKTTLMRSLACYALPGLDHLKILLVEQHVEGDDDTPMQWLLRADVERTSLLQDEARLNAMIHGTDPVPPDMEGVNLEVALAEVYERMEIIGASTAEARATRILTGLGFDPDTIATVPTRSLSGGWAMRAALASALFVAPDLLLLDEPTNHLDLHALVWLENYLTHRFEGMALIVSHDQYFLDAVCTDILELRSTLAGQKKGALTHFSGDYRSYEVTLEDRRRALARAKAAQELQKDKLKEFISREGKKYDGSGHQSQRKMKMKKLENMEDIEEIEEDIEGSFTIPPPSGIFADDEVLIGVERASFGWEQGNNLFEDVDFIVPPRGRIGIIGKNGCGKTCLLNVLLGELDPSVGTIRRHTGCRITMLQQHHYKGEQLDPDKNPLEHMRDMPQDASNAVGLYDPGTRQEETAQRSYLANFGIQGTRAVIPVRYLSGGQRMKVALAVALYNKPDVLILDEPTNHLDSDTVRALGDALDTYKGAIIVVSHDEAFINRLLTGSADGIRKENVRAADVVDGQLWVLSKKRLNRFDGSFRDYKKKIMKKLRNDPDFAV
eukprot:CAMPEP_0185033886 /NCGR_PEP_ID=MMETSP1103-20130426/23279_1 /TAXON_ID=36769 /ORGANISM="Paraphysomonas bandaiensis, Strain Caron Lab Isolate" /LENGTH=757 /DNA_ID=CAMNT_0027570319 /DNA_START=75 /DNA_END=2348 /DNA_ORIENTATION=+